MFTYMFMHGSWTHLFFNMFALWMFGGIMERTFGEKRFLTYYIICGLGAAVCQEISQTFQFFTKPVCDYYENLNSTLIEPLSEYSPSQIIYIEFEDKRGIIHQTFNDISTYICSNFWTTVGASGAIYGILLAFGMTYPEERLFVFPLPIPLKAKWFVMIYVVIELMSALSQRGDGVAHVAHLGGMLFGYILIRMWRNSYRDYNYRTRHYSDGWDGYEIKDDKSSSIFSKIRNWFRIENPNDNHKVNDKENINNETYNKRKEDWQFNAEKKKKETEIDIILDKIRKSGYSSLSEEEKKKLFDQSKFKKV